MVRLQRAESHQFHRSNPLDSSEPTSHVILEESQARTNTSKLAATLTFFVPNIPEHRSSFHSDEGRWQFLCRRQYGELATKIGRSGRRLIADGYYEYLGEKLVTPLLSGDRDPTSAIDAFMEQLDYYNLTRDLVVENLMETRTKQVW